MNLKKSSVLGIIAQNKFATVLCITTIAFLVSTIVLAVELSNERDINNETATTVSATETTVSTDAADTTTATTTTITTTVTTTEPTTTESDVTEAPETLDYRLPSNIKPTLYNIFLHPDLVTGDYSGIVVIDLDISTQTNQIILHSNLLSIDFLAVTDDGNAIPVQSHELVAELEQLVINLEQTIVGVMSKLTIEFSGVMYDKIVGLYSSSYKDDDGNDM